MAHMAEKKKRHTPLKLKGNGMAYKAQHPYPWDYHHIQPVFGSQQPTQSQGTGGGMLVKGLSMAIFVLGLLILTITAVRWWRHHYSVTTYARGYRYSGSDTRLQGVWLPTEGTHNTHPILIRNGPTPLYLYHASVPSDRSLWIFGTSLDEGNDSTHLAYAAGPRNELENLVITGGGHNGQMSRV